MAPVNQSLGQPRTLVFVRVLFKQCLAGLNFLKRSLGGKSHPPICTQMKVMPRDCLLSFGHFWTRGRVVNCLSNVLSDISTLLSRKLRGFTTANGRKFSLLEKITNSFATKFPHNYNSYKRAVILLVEFIFVLISDN